MKPELAKEIANFTNSRDKDKALYVHKVENKIAKTKPYMFTTTCLATIFFTYNN